MRLLTLITVPHDPHCSRRLGIACAHWSPLPHCSASKPRVRGDAVGALQRSQQCGYRSSSATWRSTRAPAIPVHRGRDRAHPAPSSHACSCNPQPHATALLRAHLAAGRPHSEWCAPMLEIDRVSARQCGCRSARCSARESQSGTSRSPAQRCRKFHHPRTCLCRHTTSLLCSHTCAVCKEVVLF